VLPQILSRTFDVPTLALVLQHINDPEITSHLQDEQHLARGWCIKTSSSLVLPVFLIPHFRFLLPKPTRRPVMVFFCLLLSQKHAPQRHV